MRAAAPIRWTALDLARASKVGVATIRRADVVEGEIPVTLGNEAALRRALEAPVLISSRTTAEGKAFASASRENPGLREHDSQFCSASLGCEYEARTRSYVELLLAHIVSIAQGRSPQHGGGMEQCSSCIDYTTAS